MKYFLDTEFIEDGKTIDLVSIGIFSEDGRRLYRQNRDAVFSNASDWVWRNVFPHLVHFNMRGIRSCSEPSHMCCSDKLTAKCCAPECPWAYRFEIRDAVKEFCDPEKYGKPEFWGYYADYDWVAFCQLFGAMIELPKGFPMYCQDIKQLCDFLGNPELPPNPSDSEHHALKDAEWNKTAYDFLMTLNRVRESRLIRSRKSNAH